MRFIEIEEDKQPAAMRQPDLKHLPRLQSGEALPAPLGDDVVWNPKLVEIFAQVSDEIEPGDINLSKLSDEEVLKLL